MPGIDKRRRDGNSHTGHSWHPDGTLRAEHGDRGPLCRSHHQFIIETFRVRRWGRRGRIWNILKAFLICWWGTKRRRNGAINCVVLSHVTTSLRFSRLLLLLVYSHYKRKSLSGFREGMRGGGGMQREGGEREGMKGKGVRSGELGEAARGAR